MHFTHSRTVELIAICTCLSGTQGKTNRKKFRRIVIPGGRHVGIAGGAQRPSGGHLFLKIQLY